MALKEKIEKLYSEPNFEKISTKKFITTLKIIVLDGERDLSLVAKKSGLTEFTLKKHLKDNELLNQFLTNYEYEEFLLIKKEIDKYEEQKQEKEKYRLTNCIINEILTTRYSIEDVCKNNSINTETLEGLLKDTQYLKENFGEKIVEEIKFRIKETSIIRQAKPENKSVVEESESLNILNSKIHYLDDNQLKIIKVASKYLLNGADIYLVSDKLEMPIQSIFNYISDPIIKDLIKENYYNKLQNYIKIETVLLGEDLNNKRDLINQSINMLKTNEYNVKSTCEKLGIPQELLKRILKEELTFVIIEKNEIEKIQNLFELDENTKKTK